MYDYVIVHGSYGTPYENWFSWLFNKLEENGETVLAPQFPCGKDIQNYDNWSRIMDAYKPYISENTTFIGHSLGPAFIVDYILNNNLKVKNLFLVAPFYDVINIPDFDYVNKPFFIRDDIEHIVELCKASICFISRNDPYVPNDLSESFADKIGSEKIFVDDAGHFNTSAGYTTFNQLYDKIISNKKKY